MGWMWSPGATENRAGGPRGQARRISPCVHVCLRARRRLPSVPLVTSRNRAAPAPERCLVCASWVPSGKMAQGCRAEHQRRGGCGAETWVWGQGCSLGNVCSQRPRPKLVTFSGTFVHSSEVQQKSYVSFEFWVSGLGSPIATFSPCCLRASSLPPRAAPAIWKAQWLPSQDDFWGSLQLPFVRIPPEVWALRTGALGRGF